MLRSPTLPQLEQAVRVDICSHCPLRKGYVEASDIRRTCEGDCSLFIHLPSLLARAEKLEPIMGRTKHESVLRSHISNIIQADRQRLHHLKCRFENPLLKHGDRLAQILAQMVPQ